MDERLLSPKRTGSSPPSPVFDLPPNVFMATANASCDSLLMLPRLIAPVTNRFTISLAGSTSSRLDLTTYPTRRAATARPRVTYDLALTSLTSRRTTAYHLELLLVAAWSETMPMGV